ncbi:hypothetical protein M3Y99_01325900 [Aphelenchoides fujianensis]|nr:hypothetical protein M3Y99_01325900 [Aphelenchoides fujianensis]
MDSKYKTRRLEGKVAVLTAASSGIGYATAERLGHEGASVVISSRSQRNVDDALRQLEASGIPGDRLSGVVCHVGKAEDRRRLIEFAVRKHGRIDVLFHNAGVNPAVGEILDVSESQYDKLMDTNITAPFLLTRLALPHMKPGSSIIFNATISCYAPLKGVTTYGALKLALIAITQVLSTALAPRGIRVNCVAPGLIKTEMGRIMWDPNHPKKNEVINGIPSWIRRVGQPEDVAALVAYFASEDASFVTGETTMITGGVNARL